MIVAKLPDLIIIRRKAGYSQKKLAKHIGCTHTSMSQIESYKQGVSIRLARNICKELSVDFNDIFFNIDKKDLSKLSRMLDEERLKNKVESFPENLYEEIGVYDEPCRKITVYEWEAKLTPKEISIIHLRFEDNLTHKEIGHIYGVSKGRISQIIQKAISKMTLTGEEIEVIEEIEEIEEIKELNLSTRAQKILCKAGVKNIEQLRKSLSDGSLDRIRGYGKLTYNEIISSLKEREKDKS